MPSDPEGQLFVDSDLESLQQRLVTSFIRASQMQMQTNKPLLNFNELFKVMIGQCVANLRVFIEAGEDMTLLLQRCSNAMRMYYYLGLFDLLLIMNDNYKNGTDWSAQKVALGQINCWAIKIEHRLKERKDYEQRDDLNLFPYG